MSKLQFTHKYGPWALITGASAGIGKAFANELASRGLNVILVARRKSLLDDLAAELTSKYSIKTRTIEADMSDINAVNEVILKTQDLDVGLMIPNAGIEIHQLFDKQDWQQVNNLLQINVTAPTKLAHHYSGLMRKKGRGGILFVSSVMGLMPSSFFAQYSASKAYVQLLAEGMNRELKSAGVDVSVLAPNLTKTDMGDTVTQNMSAAMKSSMMAPEAVVLEGLSALGKHPSRVPGFLNRIQMFIMTRLMPRKLWPNITYRVFSRIKKS